MPLGGKKGVSSVAWINENDSREKPLIPTLLP